MNEVYRAVYDEVHSYCQSKGYREGSDINNFVPHDAVAAFGLAKHLISEGLYDCFIATAPEGHIYGFFFEKLGVTTLDIYVPYPPTSIQVHDELTSLQGSRLLIIEDDLVTGKTLQLVVNAVIKHQPGDIGLFLGHSKSIQHPENAPDEIRTIHFAADIYDMVDPVKLEREFLIFFATQ